MSAGDARGPSMARGARDWDAATYHRVSDFQLELGTDVLARLPLEGHETVLDAGCGTGRVTRLLAERLPEGRVLAVDASADMVERARRELPANCDVRQSDLLELRLESAVDAILSTAVFHWVPDHDRLFERLFECLVPGGRLVAQCGGQGNVQKAFDAITVVREHPPFAEFLSGWDGPWTFPAPEDARARLERAGFRDVRTWLERRPMVPEQPADYLRTVTLGLHLARLPAEHQDGFVDAVLRHLGHPPEIDYVRLNIDARRP